MRFEGKIFLERQIKRVHTSTVTINTDSTHFLSESFKGRSLRINAAIHNDGDMVGSHKTWSETGDRWTLV